MSPRPVCAAKDESGPCTADPKVLGLCSKHYMRLRRSGTLNARQPDALENGETVSFVLERRTREAVRRLAAERRVSESSLYRESIARLLADTKKIGT